MIIGNIGDFPETVLARQMHNDLARFTAYQKFDPYQTSGAHGNNLHEFDRLSWQHTPAEKIIENRPRGAGTVPRRLHQRTQVGGKPRKEFCVRNRRPSGVSFDFLHIKIANELDHISILRASSARLARRKQG